MIIVTTVSLAHLWQGTWGLSFGLGLESWVLCAGHAQVLDASADLPVILSQVLSERHLLKRKPIQS
eukprot:4861481-Amphidinium_carterae.1